MNSSRRTKLAGRAFALAALLAASAGAAPAQRGNPTGPPVTTKGSTKSNPRADKGQAIAEAKRAEAREDKAVRTAVKAQEDSTRRALSLARSEPKALLKGIELSKSRRETVDAIQRRYDEAIKDLRKDEDAAAKAGQARFALVAKLEALRARERAELRAGLTPAEQVRYDQNLAALRVKKS